MHDTYVKMKDGRTLCGPIWAWCPKEGYFTLAGEDEPVQLSEVESAVTRGQRSVNGPEDRDELERARKDGWTG